MTFPALTRRTLGGLLAATALASRAQAQRTQFEQVATFERQVTGVTVTPDGRIFVNFPRWEEDVAVSVGELMHDGSVRAYPNEAWNAWRNTRHLANDSHFVCVQSVVAGPDGSLWVVDPAAPGNSFNLKNGPKLVRIDLKTNKAAETIVFDDQVVPQGSYLNDVRISPDGRTAYLTDSGVVGALIVVDLPLRTARRLLSGRRSTQVDKSVEVTTGGKPLRRPDGRPPAFAADGIALDPKGEYLYWQVLVGKTLYRMATKTLRDASLAPDAVAAAVETVGTTCVADGILMDRKGRLWITSPEDNSVKLRRSDGTLDIVVQDERLQWPDTLSEGPDGRIYVTSSHIQDMAQWHEHGSTRRIPYGLWRFSPPG